MYYAEPVYRPPSEHASLLIQATVGCSAAAAGRCHFCNSNIFHSRYPEKKFRIRPVPDIVEDIKNAKTLYGQRVEKVFLLDSNAMIMKTADLLTILKACYDSFPQLRQVSCYACSSDILNKSPSELELLYRAGLNLVYLGLESGAPEVLVLMNKGAKVDKQVEAVLKAKSAGIRTSVSVILGLGGRKYSLKHSKLTGEALSMMAPTYAAALTLMVVPGTVLDRMIQEGGFDPVDEPAELLNEARVMIDTINVNEPVVFRANHASNYFAVAGTLPHEKKRMLQSIETAIEKSSLLRPENSRRL